MFNKKAQSRGGKSRARHMTPEQRKNAARKAARARWGEKKPKWLVSIESLVAVIEGDPHALAHRKALIELGQYLTKRES